MTIARKILLGYGLLLMLVFIDLFYALSSLNQMDSINETVLNINNPLMERADRLVENLLVQESYSRRLSILKDRGSFELLLSRFDEFDRILREMSAIGTFASVQDLAARGSAFRSLVSGHYGSLSSARSISPMQHERITAERQELIAGARLIVAEVRQDQSRKDTLSVSIRRKAYWTLLTFGIGSVLVAVGMTLLFARTISVAVGHLKQSARLIAEGRFDEVRTLERGDEFGDVSRSMTDMAKKIERLEKMNLEASPLTLLPGGVAIDETIRTRLDAGTATAICIIDLDNFKIVNDRYGYARGNQIIQTTAKIITETVNALGADDDFVGHIGGDDFIVVTRPERFEAICKAVIARFDEAIPAFYDPPDRRRKAIVAKNRQGQEVTFPIMTVSIAVVTDQAGAIRNPNVLSKRAAELKDHAKSLPGSIYVVDKRGRDAGEDA